MTLDVQLVITVVSMVVIDIIVVIYQERKLLSKGIIYDKEY